MNTNTVMFAQTNSHVQAFVFLWQPRVAAGCSRLRDSRPTHHHSSRVGRSSSPVPWARRVGRSASWCTSVRSVIMSIFSACWVVVIHFQCFTIWNYILSNHTETQWRNFDDKKSFCGLNVRCLMNTHGLKLYRRSCSRNTWTLYPLRMTNNKTTHRGNVNAGLEWVLRCTGHCQRVQLAVIVHDDVDVAWRCYDVERHRTLADVDPSDLVVWRI